MREPAFWWRPPGAVAALLAPLAAVYGSVAGRRLRRDGTAAGIPVLCLGNFTTGGAGKTPAALAVARMLRNAGASPFFLTRGYGGVRRGPLRVDPARHRAAEVGDEPLLLAAIAPTIVARDRVAGAALARAEGAGVVVMDDGFQNPSLRKDCSILVVDAARGVGNGRVIPAGPLRAPLAPQLERMHALLLVGPGEGAAPVGADARARGIPVFRAVLRPDPDAVTALRGRQLHAFAGIGDPEKFFATLAGAGLDVAARQAFADHHRYRAAEAGALLARAARDGLTLVTTEKDLARLRGEPALAALAAAAHALPVALDIADTAGLLGLVTEKLGLESRPIPVVERSAPLPGSSTT